MNITSHSLNEKERFVRIEEDEERIVCWNYQ